MKAAAGRTGVGKRRVAVFDIDGTLFRSSLVIELVEKLIEKGLFPPESRQEYEEARIKYLNREGDYATHYTNYVNALVKVFGRQIKGLPFDEVSYIAGEVIEEKKNRLYRYTRDLVRKLKKRGYFLLAVSRSPKFIVDGLGYELGFDKVYGTFYATGASDNFTGLIEDEDLIKNKAAVLTRAVRKENLTLEGSLAVGDTETDIPMLEMVETPICFNPNAALYKHAKRRKWKVVVERKDVIYEL